MLHRHSVGRYRTKKMKAICIYQIWLNLVFISFNHLEVTISSFLFFSLFSSQWLHLRLTFSRVAPHVSRAVAIQCDYCCACLFHQCKTVKTFTKTGASRPDIYFCKKVLDYQILTEDIAKINDGDSQIVHEVTFNLAHLCKSVQSGLRGCVPSSLRHSRALCQAGKPLEKQTGGAAEGRIDITPADCFPSHVKKEWRLQCLPGRASWQINLPWKPPAHGNEGPYKGWSEGERQRQSQALVGSAGKLHL